MNQRPGDMRIPPKDKDGNVIKDKNGNIIWEPATCACGQVWDKSQWHHIEEPNGDKKPDECFYCYCWRGNLESDSKTPDKVVIVNGDHYQIGNEPSKDHPTGMYGYGGSEFRIQFNDGRQVITHNLWHQGTIPEYWKAKFPDNAIFVQKFGRPEPTKKSEGMEALIDSLNPSGKTRRGSITSGTCSMCGNPTGEFRDALSRKEYTISGWCQKCQDKMFKPEEDE